MENNAPVVIEQDQPQAQRPEPPVELVTIRADELAHLRAKANVVAAVVRLGLVVIGLVALLTAIVAVVAILAD